MLPHGDGNQIHVAQFLAADVGYLDLERHARKKQFILAELIRALAGCGIAYRHGLCLHRTNLIFPADDRRAAG